jgi:hypothetical protein
MAVRLGGRALKVQIARIEVSPGDGQQGRAFDPRPPNQTADSKQS